jgi:hypothetical protein
MSGGASLGMGRSKSASYNESDSQSYGYSGSNSSDISRSIQEAVSGGQSRSTQGVFAGDMFQQLYGGAAGAAGRASIQAPELAMAAQQLFTGGSSFLSGLGGDAGSTYLENRVTGESPVLQEQIDALREDTGRLFTEEFNPAITSRAVAGGTLGGGRQGVAQGIAMDSLTREFARGATALRANDVNARDAAAQSIASNSLAAANTGLGALPGLLDLKERGVNSELGIFASLSNILGGPTVLGESQSSDFSRSTAQSIAEAFSRSFGEQSSRSRSEGWGRASAWDFNTAVGGGLM